MHRAAAVHVEDLAGDEAGPVGREEGDAFGYLLGLGIATHGDGVGESLDSGEVGNPPELFADVFAAAAARGLRAVAHAGEEGHLGREELDTIIPALEQLAAEGVVTEGPLPADTLFTPRYLEKADAVLAMYHDQGLPVLKHMGFGNAVNITLGLPIIRTSVDHGTALELAGSGDADCGSLIAAIETARQMIQR